MREAPTEAFGPYLVYERLGIGGMARVDRAELANEGRPVALKRMLPHVAENDDMVRAFVREARLASQLRHVNVAQTYEIGQVGETYFIAMELIPGRTLRQVVEHCAVTTGPMPVPIALNIINQICEALDYAHNLCDEAGRPLGIVHRDVSPSNIILAEGGVVKLIDFGIAKASASGMQTTGGAIKGKFGYMAPEYLAGRIDARADLFALGVIAHELLTNRPLFTLPDNMQTLARVREMPIHPPSRTNPLVRAEIDETVMTALARDPDQRWQHATALHSALTTLTTRLGLVADNQQVFDWIEWVFDQTTFFKPRRAPSPSERVLEHDRGQAAARERSSRSLPLRPREPTQILEDSPLMHPPAGTPVQPMVRPTPGGSDYRVAGFGRERTAILIDEPGDVVVFAPAAVPRAARGTAQVVNPSRDARHPAVRSPNPPPAAMPLWADRDVPPTLPYGTEQRWMPQDAPANRTGPLEGSTHDAPTLIGPLDGSPLDAPTRIASPAFSTSPRRRRRAVLAIMLVLLVTVLAGAVGYHLMPLTL